MTETILPQNWDESGRDARPPNVRHLRACLAVAEAGSITGAAEALHLTQPAITQGVRNIEERFGAELFRRTKTGVELTPAGEVMRRRLERAFELMEELRSFVIVIVSAGIGAPNDHADEVLVLPQHLVADRRLQQMPMLGQPGLELDQWRQLRLQVGCWRGHGRAPRAHSPR